MKLLPMNKPPATSMSDKLELIVDREEQKGKLQVAWLQIIHGMFGHGVPKEIIPSE